MKENGTAKASTVLAPVSDLPVDSTNPILSVIGAFEDDPEYDALMEAVYKYRRELDAQENQDDLTCVSS